MNVNRKGKGARLDSEEHKGTVQPTAATRPTELRYRLADFINDRLRILPGWHRALKSVLAGVAPEKMPAKGSKESLPATQMESQSITPIEEPREPNRETLPVHESIPLDSLPYPPLEMRELVGLTDLKAYDNPTGTPLFSHLNFGLDPKIYERVFDFGCGCGRIARQLMLQKPSPKAYVGIDLHAGMVRWCQKNLQPAAPHFRFFHHDVFNVGFNPKPGSPLMAPFPVEDSQFSFVIAHSVFTHLTQSQAVFYLRECARILDPEGVLYASWFFFDKENHPMMQENNNALYVSYEDPCTAVMFDKQWVKSTAHEMGLKICNLRAPGVRGHQWPVIMTRRQDIQEPDFPPDNAPPGLVRPPIGSGRDPATIGLEAE